MNKSTIQLEHVGPIEHLTIPIPENGGLVVLRGANGCGKTHAIHAVGSLSSKESRRALRNSDGVPSGSIQGLGVTVRLGRVNTSKGDLVCESLQGRVDPSLLVDPGIKDAEKADAKRLVTLVQLSGIEVDVNAWNAMVGGNEQALEVITPLVDDDPIATADRIRRKLHSIALAKERQADSQMADSKALLKTIEDIEFDGDWDSETLANALEQASANVATAERMRDTYAKAVSSRDAAKSKLEGLESIDVDAIEKQLNDAIEAFSLNSEKCKSLELKISELNQELTESQKSLAGSKHSLDLAEQRHSDAVMRNDERAELSEMLKGELPETVNNEALIALTKAKLTARQNMEHGEVVRRAVETKKEAENHASKSKETAKDAVAYRQLAHSTDSVLEQSLYSAGFDAIKVHDGRLCVETDRGLEPFSELSHGERWRIALDLAASGLPSGSVLPVCQEAFESLDPGNRKQIATLAEERKLVIITAEATGGDLRAEVLEGGDEQ